MFVPLCSLSCRLCPVLLTGAFSNSSFYCSTQNSMCKCSFCYLLHELIIPSLLLTWTYWLNCISEPLLPVYLNQAFLPVRVCLCFHASYLTVYVNCHGLVPFSDSCFSLFNLKSLVQNVVINLLCSILYLFR